MEVESLQELHYNILRWFDKPFPKNHIFSLDIPKKLEPEILFQQSCIQGNFITKVNNISNYPIKINKTDRLEIVLNILNTFDFIYKPYKSLKISNNLSYLLNL